MSRACAALNNFDFSSDDSSSSEEDEKVKRKQGDFTGLFLMGKFSRNIFDSDFDVSYDLSPKKTVGGGSLLETDTKLWLLRQMLPCGEEREGSEGQRGKGRNDARQ
jgi:hypothetical protein